jgi:hypothetical protein
MSNKLLAGLLVGATFLATSLTTPALANNNYQNLLNAEAMQAYTQNMANQQYGYGYGYGNGIGAPGINPNDPNAFREAQYQQWLQTQGGNAGYANHGFVNSAINPNGGHYNNGWNNRAYRMHR